MDLSLSPDLEAYWCYLILAAIAIIVAAVQVRSLLKGYNNAWSTARAWLLLVAYSAVPIVLFWLLDRSDAIHDTSLFAAVLVGVTYRQILSGGTQGVTVPTGFAKAWKPFVIWSDKIAAGIRDRIARNTSRYEAKVIERLATDETVFREVNAIVLNRSVEPAQTQTILNNFDRLKPPLDDAGLAERKAKYLYSALKALPDIDADQFLKDRNIISTKEYYLFAREWRSSIFVGVMALLVGIAMIFAVVRLRQPRYEAEYYLWRFEKPNATATDRFRAARHLEDGMRSGDAEFNQIVRQELTNQLRYAALPLDTADRMLRLLFERSDSEADSSLMTALADSLRTDNPELRARTQKVLVYLADQRHVSLPEALRFWRPSKEDADTCIDTVATVWSQLAKPNSASPNKAALECLSKPEPANGKN